MIDSRVPFAPLEDHLQAERGPLGIRRLCEVLKADNRQIMAWREKGVRWHLADRLAVRAGTTVWNVWGEVWAQLCVDDEGRR